MEEFIVETQDDLMFIANKLTEEEIEYLKMCSLAELHRIYILPPTTKLYDLGLVRDVVDYTARPNPRYGWQCTPLGLQVSAAIYRHEAATAGGFQ